MTKMRYPFDADAAVRALRRADPELRRTIDRAGPFALLRRAQRSPFESLLRAIVYQSVSGSSAAATHARLLELLDGRRATPRGLIALSEAQLRATGLSRAKAAALHDLAEKTLTRAVPGRQALEKLDDEEIVERLCRVRGIGRWTAEMLLMFYLARPDVLPLGDVRLGRGFALVYGLPAAPGADALTAHAERWRPWRTVASWYLFQRAMEGAPASANP